MMLIDPDSARPMARGVFGAMNEFTNVQRRFGSKIFEVLVGRPLEDADRVPLGPDELADALPSASARVQFMHLLVLFELIVHPLPAEQERRTEEYGRALGVDPPLVGETRALTRRRYGLAYLELARHSWYVKRTLIDSVHGKLYERIRSELGYLGVGDPAIARRWRALGDLPEGSWGREVDRFYDRNGFPRPGEQHGIYELGAKHDWVHVLTGYDTTPVGEIKVFGFIAANMADPAGFTMLAVTLGLFQTGTITHMHGKLVKNATIDALDTPAAAEAFAEAISYGGQCTRDIMSDIDVFAEAARPLAEVRVEFGLPPEGLQPQVADNGAAVEQ